MRILITGAAGMLGTKLRARLGADPELGGREIEAIDLVDVVPIPTRSRLETGFVGDLAHPGVAAEVVDRRPDLVFHLAGVVSGEAEADFEKGYRTNLDGTRVLYEAIRRAGGTPKLVFTSSIAVFGAPFPEAIDDDFHLTPLTSYGVQKMMCEGLLADYSRRGFFDGVGVRLPTLTVRPGAPNAAASGFFSSIIREPLSGRRASLPVSRSVRHPHASPRSAVGFLVHAAGLDTDRLGTRRNLTMPSVSATVGEQIDALARIAGPDKVELIDEVEDEVVTSIVAGWPRRFSTPRARELGFEVESTYGEIIEAYIEDDL